MEDKAEEREKTPGNPGGLAFTQRRWAAWSDMKRTFGPAQVWICFAAYCTCVGWVLSALHQLNAAGYLIASLVGLAGFGWWWTKSARAQTKWLCWSRLRKRFCRLTPAIFLIFAIVAFLEGAFYPPRYYDALAYRVPRVLHWLAAGRWHWIHTGFERVNVRGCGAEWLSAPIIALFKTDRPLFLLISFLPFCVLPGLIFSSFVRIGINRRAAYAWMWLLPLGCCFLLQASDIGNDLLAAMFMLAAFAFALKAKQAGRIEDLWISMLAMGLATGVKATTMPLGLVWAVVAVQCWRLCWKRWPGTIAVSVIAAAISFLPTAFFNYQHSHDWTGGKAEGVPFATANPWARMAGNVELSAALNLEPPIAPFARTWNEKIAPKLQPERFKRVIHENLQFIERPIFSIDEMQTDASGLGLQITGLLGLSTVAALLVARRRRFKGGSLNAGRSATGATASVTTSGVTIWRGGSLDSTQRLVIVAIGVAYVAFLKSSSVVSIARLMAPCYIFLAIPFLLARGHEVVERSSAWRVGVLAAACLAAIPLVLRPDRPIVPVERIVDLAEKEIGPRPWLARAKTVYGVYGHRDEAFAPALEMLPPGTRVVGVVTFDDPETSLWKPFGSRRIFHVCPDDTAETLKAKGVRYVLVGEFSYHLVFSEKLEDWLARIHGRILQTKALRLRAGPQATTWDLVAVGDDSGRL